MKNPFSSKGEQGGSVLKRRGFYLALALSLLAIGVSVYIGINATMDSLNDANLPDNVSSPTDNTNSIEQVDKTQSDVAITSTDTDDIESENSAETQSDIPTNATTSTTPIESVPATTSDDTAQTSATPQEFAMPLKGEIIQEYSNGELVKSETLKEWRTHDGIDIKASAETPVKSIADGVIESVVEDTLWGVQVTIAHDNGYTSIYSGLKTTVPVKVGQEVLIGDVIGYIGDTAEIEMALDSHLHLGVKKDDKWVNPSDLF